MATSHDIGGMVNNQIASFGNMTNAARSIPPFGVQPQGMVPGQGFGQQQPSFGVMGMAGTAFTPMGPAFAPPGAFPGMGLQRSALGISGAAAQAGGQMIPGMATLGMAGFAMGGAPGAAAGMAVGAVGDFFTNTITQTVQNMNATTNMMQAQRFQFGAGTGALGPSGGFTSGQAGQIAGGIQNMGMQNVLSSVAEIREITSQLGNLGIFQTARDIPDIMGKLGETLKALRTIAVSAQTTLSGAMPIFAELRQAGFVQPGQMAGMVQNMAAGQRAGVSMTQQMQAGGQIAGMAMQAGLPGQGAFFGAVQATQNLSRARQRGVLSEEDFQRLTMGTGDASIAAIIQQQQTMRMAQGPAGIVAGGAGVMGAAGFGAAPFGTMMNIAAGNLADPSAMIDLLNRQDEVSGALASDQFAMVRIADSMAESLALPTKDRTQARQIVLQRVGGLSAFQARMISQQFDARHELAIGQTMDDMMQAETSRIAQVAREFSPQAIMNKVGRGAFNALGGATVAEHIRLTMTGIGTDAEKFFRRVSGARSFVAGAGTEEAMAQLIAGAADISGLRDIRRTGMMDTAGGLASALGFTGLGKRGGGILATERGRQVLMGAADAADVDVGKAVLQLREAQGMREAGRLGEEKQEMTDLIASVNRNVQFRTSTADVLTRFERLRKALPDAELEDLRFAAAASDADWGGKMLVGISFGRLRLDDMAEKYQSSLKATRQALLRTGPPRGRAQVGVPTGLSGDAADLGMKVMQDPELGKTFSQMARAFSEGDAEKGLNLMSLLSKKVDKFGDEASEHIRSIAGIWGGQGGQAKAKEFLDIAATAESNKEKWELGTAAVAFASEIESGLASLPDELKGRMPKLVALTDDIRKSMSARSTTEFRRAHQNLVARVIAEADLAEGEEGFKRMQEIGVLLKATGMEVIGEALRELKPEELGVGRARGITKISDIALEKARGKLEGDIGAAQKLAAGDKGFEGTLTEYINLNTKILAAALSGKKFSKIGAELSEESHSMLETLTGGGGL